MKPALLQPIPPLQETDLDTSSPVLVSSKKKFRLSPAWQGGLWKILSCFCFAGINGIVRYLTGGSPLGIDEPLPVATLTFFQNLFGTFFLLPWVFKYGISNLGTRKIGLHTIRVISAVLGVLLWYWALFYMPIAQAVALSFTGPVFTVIAARFLLAERITRQRLIAIGLSFMGAFIILRPDHSLFSGSPGSGLWTLLLPLMSAIAIAISKLTTRKLGMLGESAHKLTTYLLLFMAPLSLIPALFNWVTPHLSHWPWILLMGLLAAGAHFSFSLSYVKGEVSFLTPFGFFKLIFSCAVGYFAFGEFPSTWTVWLGTSVILASVILLTDFKRSSKPQIDRKKQE